MLSAAGFDVGERTPAMTNENCRMPLRRGVLRHRRGAVEDAFSRATSVSDVATSLVTLDSHWCAGQLALYTLLHAPCHIARRHAMSAPVTLREFIMDSAASWFPLDAFGDALINASEM